MTSMSMAESPDCFNAPEGVKRSGISDDTERSCREFARVLASSAAVPGGGGAAALTAALGTALGGMVGALTVGKPRYAASEEALRRLTERCSALREQLLDEVAADAAGFAPLAGAYRIPKNDPNREAALEQAAAGACAAPLRMMELCCEALRILAVMAEKGSRLAVSDAGCGAALVKGGMQAAALNVLVNTRTLKDRALARTLNSRCLGMLEEYERLADEIFESVKKSLFK